MGGTSAVEESSRRWVVCKLCFWWFVLVYSFFMVLWRQFASVEYSEDWERWKSVHIYITIELFSCCNNSRWIFLNCLCVMRNHFHSHFFQDGEDVFSLSNVFCLHFVYSRHKLQIAMYHLANVRSFVSFFSCSFEWDVGYNADGHIFFASLLLGFQN